MCEVLASQAEAAYSFVAPFGLQPSLQRALCVSYGDTIA